MFRSRLLSAFLVGVAVDAGVSAFVFLSTGFIIQWLFVGWMLGWLPGLFSGYTYWENSRGWGPPPDDDPD